MHLWNKIKSVFTAPATEAAPVPEAPILLSSKYTRTDGEKALISEFKLNHALVLEKLEDAIYTGNTRMKKAEDSATKAELCRKTIQAYEKLRTVCQSTGAGGTLYFEDMWEHCSNSSNPDFRFIDPVEEILSQLISEKA